VATRGSQFVDGKNLLLLSGGRFGAQILDEAPGPRIATQKT
jgi:hypothetical protein